MCASLADCILDEPVIPYLCKQHERAFAISPGTYVCSPCPGRKQVRTLAQSPAATPWPRRFCNLEDMSRFQDGTEPVGNVIQESGH